MHKITGTIITQNEADRIGHTLASITGVVDELIVIDSGSHDGTVAICRQWGAQVIHNDWPGFGPQKRFAADQARHHWILNLDADEVLSDHLRQEIIAWKTHGKDTPAGFRFKQITVYPGQEHPRLWADYHHYIRLYDRRVMRFRNSLTHDAVETGHHNIGTFKGDCLHYSYRSLDHLVTKLDSYTSLQAREIKKARWAMIIRRPFEYPVLFFRYYIMRRHFTGGIYGLKVAHVIAKGRAARIQKFLAVARS